MADGTRTRSRRGRQGGQGSSGGGNGAAAKTEPEKKTKEPRPLTKFVVLRAVRLDMDALGSTACARTGRPLRGVLGDGAITPQVAWLPVLNTEAAHGPDGEVRVIEAGTQDEAIQAVTGRWPRAGEVLASPDDYPAPGQWKAVSLTSWKGWRGFDQPAQVWQVPTEQGDD